MAGALAQGLFRNPLADPYLLGSASGASLGVAVALALFGGNPFATEFLVRLGLTGAAFAGAVLAVLLTLVLARGVQHTLRLLLAGVIVGVVLGALASLITLLRPDVLQGMQGFLLGSTSFIGWNSCVLMLCVLLVCVAVAFALSRVLDALSLGESTALSLGLPLAPVRVALVCVLALATGTAVAQTGLVAFVGLAAPHLVRSLVKTKHSWIVLLSTLMGGVLLLSADLLARMLRNLKEVFRAQEDWPRMLAVLNRLVVLLPEVWTERRDRGLVHAELGHMQEALHDLQVYLGAEPLAPDQAALKGRLRELSGDAPV